MTILYQTIICPRCKEDHLIIEKNNANNELYLCCSECEAAWHNIDDAKLKINMFVSPDLDSSDPDISEIRKYGWENLITGEIEV